MTPRSQCLATEDLGSDLDHYEIREGNAVDFPQIARLAEAVYGVRRSVDSVRWLYQANPSGPCKLWLAEDHSTKEIVALRPVFPWRSRIRGCDVLVGQAGDAMTHPAFRGRGLFSDLVRASWSELFWPRPGPLTLARWLRRKMTQAPFEQLSTLPRQPVQNRYRPKDAQALFRRSGFAGARQITLAGESAAPLPGHYMRFYCLEAV